MGFHKAIARRIRAGNKNGRAGRGAARKTFRWGGTLPTAYWKVEGIATDATGADALPNKSKNGADRGGTFSGTIVEGAGATQTWNSTETPPGSNQSLYFNGTNNKVVVPYDAALKFNNTTKKMTIAMWVKASDEAQHRYLLAADEDEASATSGWVYLIIGGTGAGATADKAASYWYSGAGAGWRSSTSDVNDDEWHQLVFSIEPDGGTLSIKIYVDGVLETTNTSQSGNLTVANVPILIGYRADGAKYYKYYMDEIAYFTDICLTAKQIKDMYNDGTVTNSFAGVRRG
jgi:hypothetical protein